ncbi:MAG: isoleucine--tRNA ligase [Candidatus Omnitrophica bacterium]|nr:isoleucine--tRNA ligase [Candidatus Omnitrophota bacterium]
MNYKETLNLPRTEFSMQARLKELEARMLRLWEGLDIYSLLQQHSKGRPKFILHDGPPYANGDIHIGHALNKILKDFVVKSKLMQGFAVPFVPGWDCHGLPVEHQLFKQLDINKHQIDKVAFRQQARDFALNFVDIQRKQFIRLGLLADWMKPYLTLDFDYEAEIVRAFAKLAKEKYIYRGLKPINWCISCETALAEAEVEYDERRSPSVLVKFELLNPESALKELLRTPCLAGRQANSELRTTQVSFLVWTTTPWTLVANAALALHPEFEYSFVEITRPDQTKEILILASELLAVVMHQLGLAHYQELGKTQGRSLENLQARHPFFQRNSPVVLAEYVSNQEGTGCVHTAPGHGQEDYLTGLKYKLPVLMPVDERGIFDQTAGQFSGTQVFKANQLIIDQMRENGSLLLAGDTLHSYPHCWRCKCPLITRSTRQWFINVEHRALRKKALKAVKKVRWTPLSAAERISSMIQVRPDWCLSRQRFWGVPIPVFYCKDCGQEILQYKLIEQLTQLIAQEGSDVWFIKSVEELLGKHQLCPRCKKTEFVKEEDIIDVWFDSGISHQAVLKKNKKLGFPAGLYLEGSDQHRGWFQTALLTSIPLNAQAPYRQVLTHGFVVDGAGKKMSKSRGNVISPQEVIDSYGAEILRLWVASCDYTDDVRISAQILTSTAEAYRKIRNTLRFLVGNLYDFTPEMKLSYDSLEELDQWALSCLSDLSIQVTQDYEHFRYYKLFRRIYNFCVQQMSSFYLDILKDTLYTAAKHSRKRRSAQTAICEILTTLTKLLAPILSFTAEELWHHLAQILGIKECPSVFLSAWPSPQRKLINQALDEKFERLNQIRSVVLKAIENEREKEIVHSSLEARVYLCARDAKLSKFLDENLKLLPAIFIVSEVLLESSGPATEAVFDYPQLPDLGVRIERINFPKCARCWNFRNSVGEDREHPLLCARCVEAIKEVE